MNLKAYLPLFGAILMAGLPSCARGQVASSAQERQLPIALGFGVSNYDIDWGKAKSGERRMAGITATLDTDLPHASGILKGFELEIEGRDINYSQPEGLSDMRQSTILGGSVYSWPYSHKVRPFAKYLWGLGAIDIARVGPYRHDTQMVMAPGGGLECRVFGAVWVRGDYEYQFWPHFLGRNTLTPNGFTISTIYDFRTRSRNRY